MDDKPGNQYGDSYRGIDCRYTFPEDTGVYSDIWKSDGSWVSDLYRKGQYLADLRRNRHWITREGMGYGDSWSILILGIYLGVWKLLEVLSTAFMLLGAAAVICLVGKKMSRKYRLPFLPFLAAGYLCSILAGGMCV